MNAPDRAMCRLIRHRRRRLRLRSYQRRLTHHVRQPRWSAIGALSSSELEALGALAAADEHLAHQLRREQAVPDDPRDGCEPGTQLGRITDRPPVVGDHAAVRALEHVPQLHFADLPHRRGEPELGEFEGNRSARADPPACSSRR